MEEYKEEVTKVETVAAPVQQQVNGDIDLFDETGHIRLVPVPSASPRDPLNWSKSRKLLVVIACCWYSIMSLSLVGATGPMLPIFIGMYVPEGVEVATVARFATWPSLFVGLGNFVFLPLALACGRRFAFLIAAAMCLIATIVCATSNNFTTNFTGTLFQALGAGITESLLPLIITDVTFVHERGKYFGIYWTTQSMLSSVLNIASTFEAERLSWRWYYGIYAIAVGIGLILAFFCCPETRFARPPASFNGQVHVTDEYGEQRVVSGEEAAAYSSYAATDVDMTPLTYGETLKVWNGVPKGGWKLAGKSYISMARCLTSPGLLWAVIYTGMVLAVSIALALTYGTVLTTKLGWPDANTGLITVGAVPGGLAANFYAGYLMDKLALRSARKNGGKHKPEARLPIIIVPTLVGITAATVYAFAIQYPERFGWPTIVVMWGCYFFCFVSSLIVSTTFAVEVCPQAPGPALVVAVAFKNVVAFGMAYGISDMINDYPAKSYLSSYGVLIGCLGAAMLLAIPVYFFNGKWRKSGAGHIQN